MNFGFHNGLKACAMLTVARQLYLVLTNTIRPDGSTPSSCTSRSPVTWALRRKQPVEALLDKFMRSQCVFQPPDAGLRRHVEPLREGGQPHGARKACRTDHGLTI